jgi:hypothetical protein
MTSFQVEWDASNMNLKQVKYVPADKHLSPRLLVKVGIVSIFKEVFARLPGNVTSVIRDYWEGLPKCDRGSFPGVSFLVRFPDETSEFRLVVIKSNLAPESAQIENSQTDGTYIAFSETFLVESPDSVIESVAAHELAHVYRIATGNAIPTEETAIIEEEVVVNKMALGWGFQQDIVEMWLMNNNRSDKKIPRKEFDRLFKEGLFKNLE